MFSLIKLVDPTSLGNMASQKKPRRLKMLLIRKKARGSVVKDFSLNFSVSPLVGKCHILPEIPLLTYDSDYFPSQKATQSPIELIVHFPFSFSHSLSPLSYLVVKVFTGCC